MTLDEAKEIIKNATDIKPIKRSATVKLGKQENNTFKDIMKRWQKK